MAADMSTPRRSSAFSASGVSNSFRNSFSEIKLSWFASASLAVSMSQRTRLAKSIWICSCSTVATVCTASTRTPTSMFITMSEPTSTNTSTNMPMPQPPSCVTSTKKPSWSGITHCTINVKTVAGTDGKSSASSAVSCPSWVKAMLKTYVMSKSSTSVKKTERAATMRPLIRIINSGMYRATRIMRAVRSTRRTRATRRTEALRPTPPPFP
mmetsp:Transcript_73541/g.172261  ORF Transcript_73541/g.172261 Transcript_73541/m.172261 type:complete len:211 (+) Transcript_73541:438-1070(+)